MDFVGVPDEVKKLIDRHPSLSIKTVANLKKVSCSLTGHEMPCQLQPVESYLQGKKFKRHAERRSLDVSRYAPHLTQSKEKGHEHQLYCSLTQRHINMIPDHVERHVNGKRFKTELQRYKDCINKGIEFKPRRKPQKKIEKEALNARKADAMSTELSFIPSDAEDEENQGDNKSDDSFSDLYPANDFTRTEDVPEDEEEMDVSEPKNTANSRKRKRPSLKKGSSARF